MRILRALEERPQNPNQLAKELNLDYTTVRHHLDVLRKYDVVMRTDESYAAVYLFTDQVKAHWDTVERIFGVIEMEQ